MPELPEVERVRLSLTEPLLGSLVVRVQIRRGDVCRAWTAKGPRAARPGDLLCGGRIAELARHGKQLAIVADSGLMCVHLGMTGGLFIAADRAAFKNLDHVHVVWEVEPRERGHPRTRRVFLVFRDPRRFGGIFAFPSRDRLERERWDALGPDALTITPGQLLERLRPGDRAIKAALLDQAVLAGVGNIYADEALFRARLSPCRRAGSLNGAEVAALTEALSGVLFEAIGAGGSSIRDYVDGRGERGSFQSRHLVYGRSGMPCLRCGATLRGLAIAQRTTVMCPRCQSSRAVGRTTRRNLSTLEIAAIEEHGRGKHLTPPDSSLNSIEKR